MSNEENFKSSKEALQFKNDMTNDNIKQAFSNEKIQLISHATVKMYKILTSGGIDEEHAYAIIKEYIAHTLTRS